MPRPSVDYPQWNTDGTNRSVPSAGLVATGFEPNAVPSSSEVNHRDHYIGTWGDHFQSELASVAGNDQFADGGATDNTLLQALLSIGAWVFGQGTHGALVVPSGTTTMTQDREYTTVVVESGGILETAGYRIWASQRVTVEAGGTIQHNGADASGGTGGAGASGAIVGEGGAGGDATFGGTSLFAGIGGNGGDGSGGFGGSSVYPSSLSRPGRLGFTMGRDNSGSQASSTLGGGCGGGGGAAGGGGGGGGVIVITTPILELEDATSVIQANGGDATSQGGGGGGGVILLSRRIQIGTGTIQCLGGDDGAGPGAFDGSPGSVITFQV